MFSNLFGKQKQNTQGYSRLQMLNSSDTIFTNFNGDAYSNELVRASIHSIAINTAKTKAKHIGTKDSYLEYLLNVRPNIYMSAFDMYYKTITQLYLNNNAYILIKRDDNGKIVGFYPINATTVDFLEHNKDIYIKFTFLCGQQMTVSYENVIHLRRHFNENDLYGSSNIITNTIQLLNTTNDGIANAVINSNSLKGLLKVTGANLKPEDTKKQRDLFVNDYVNINNKSGIAAIDSKMEYIPLTTDPKMIDDKQMTLIEEKVFQYYNINKKIIMNTFNADEYNAFYESVIEPLLIQLSSELTYKVFTSRERGFGNEIIYTSNRLNYASNDTKVNMCRELVATGVFSINEARELFNLEPLKEDKRLISLNYVDASQQNAYQLGKKEGETNNGNE